MSRVSPGWGGPGFAEAAKGRAANSNTAANRHMVNRFMSFVSSLIISLSVNLCPKRGFDDAVGPSRFVKALSYRRDVREQGHWGRHLITVYPNMGSGLD